MRQPRAAQNVPTPRWGTNPTMWAADDELPGAVPRRFCSPNRPIMIGDHPETRSCGRGFARAWERASPPRAPGSMRCRRATRTRRSSPAQRQELLATHAVGGGGGTFLLDPQAVWMSRRSARRATLLDRPGGPPSRTAGGSVACWSPPRGSGTECACRHASRAGGRRHRSAPTTPRTTRFRRAVLLHGALGRANSESARGTSCARLTLEEDACCLACCLPGAYPNRYYTF